MGHQRGRGTQRRGADRHDRCTGPRPDYLDPQRTYTTQGGEANWVSYLGLYTYAHKTGTAGGNVHPGARDGGCRSSPTAARRTR